MFIAFDGPDKTGKSTSAGLLSTTGGAFYNATKEMHEENRNRFGSDDVVTYDRIDWLTHMVYRLAMPTHEWNDARVRTVFAMPDTHLVIKIHEGDSANIIKDELYEKGALKEVNQSYMTTATYLMMMNHVMEFKLFRDISVVVVSNNLETGEYSQRLAEYAGPVYPWQDDQDHEVRSDEELLEMFRCVDQQIG